MGDSRPPSTDGDPNEVDDRRRETTDEFRQGVEERYDFDSFGPADMARMDGDEWEAAFDAETWITGEGLLRRVETDLRSRVADRDVFARIERVDDGLLAFSDEGYAVVHPDGSVEGRGTVLRDVKPTVALCSMHDYELPTPPEGDLLPDPDDVAEGTGELGNRMLQVVAAAQLIAGVGLFGAWITGSIPNPSGNVLVLPPVIGLVLVFFSLLLFLQVANARLSDRFRAAEYRDRLRAIGVGSGDRPEFLPERYRDPEPSSGSDGTRGPTASDGVGANATDDDRRPERSDDADDSVPSA